MPTVLNMQYMMGSISVVLFLYRRQFCDLSDRNIGLVQGLELTSILKSSTEFSAKYQEK